MRCTSSVSQGHFDLRTEGIEVEAIFYAWPNGRIICSEDTIEGGPPYWEKKVSRRELNRVFQFLEEQRVFSVCETSPQYGPSSDFTCIYIRNGKDEIHLKSWHELFGKDPRLIATERGIEAIGDRTRDSIAASWSDAYREFRERWTIIRTALEQLKQGARDGRHADGARFGWSG